MEYAPILLELDEVVKDRNGLLMTSHEDTGKNGMSLSAILGPVATVRLTSDHGGSQHAFRQVVGRFEVLDIQEAQEMRSMPTQSFGEAGIVRIGEAPVRCRSKHRGGLRGCEPVGRKCEAAGSVSVVSVPALLAGERSPGERTAGRVRFWFRSCPSDLAGDDRDIFV